MARSGDEDQAGEAGDGNNKRILIVDDCSDAAYCLAAVLGIQGHDVQVATDGAQALRTAHKFHPDICILDLTMPVMDGYEIGRRLRAELYSDSDEQPLKLVALSGYERNPEREQLESLRFDAHLTKPLDFNTLAKIISD